MLWWCVHSKGHSRMFGLSENGYGFADVAADMLCAYLHSALRHSFAYLCELRVDLVTAGSSTVP